MTLDNDGLIFCNDCESNIEIDEYIVKCDHEDCEDLHFCEAECWISHVQNHADRTFGYVDNKGELYFQKKDENNNVTNG